MVRERRLVLGLKDIRAFRFRCCTCRGDVIAPFGDDGEARAMPARCPLCNSAWVPQEAENPIERSVVQAIRRAREYLECGERSTVDVTIRGRRCLRYWGLGRW